MSAAGGAMAAPASTPSIDFSANSDAAPSSGDDGASLADMAAIMDAPEGGGAAEAPAAVAPEAGKAPAAAAPAPAPAAVDAAPAPAAAPAVDIAAEAAKLRKGWASLSRDKEAVVRKGQEATAALERAKSWQAKAEQFDSIGATVQADPLAFLESHGVPVDKFLDRVIEMEKSPIEREMLKLRQEIADKEANEKKARDDAEAKRAADQNQQIITDWQARNVNFATATPENAKKYDLIVNLKQGETVHQTCLAYYQQYGVVLDPQTAADNVEAHLRAGVDRSEYIKQKYGASPPAPTPPAPAKAQPSHVQTTAPKQSGTPTTLTSVASGDGVSSTSDLPNDNTDRMEAVLREMQAEGSLPDEWRLKS